MESRTSEEDGGEVDGDLRTTRMRSPSESPELATVFEGESGVPLKRSSCDAAGIESDDSIWDGRFRMSVDGGTRIVASLPVSSVTVSLTYILKMGLIERKAMGGWTR